MTLDICIPVYRNLRCLRLAAKGLFHHLTDKTAVRNVFLHVQDKEETEEALAAFAVYGVHTEVVSIGPVGVGDMASAFNGLFRRGQEDWMVLMEQDTFVHVPLDEMAANLAANGVMVAGPIDTMFYGNANARLQPHYGEHGRLSPQPGYFHASLILLNRVEVAKITNTPFTIPAGFKMHGNGVLGGESYYGLRINVGNDKTKLEFMTQDHSYYGYAADLHYFKPPGMNKSIATHLYYSATKEGYRKDGFLSESEYQWLCAEETRFLEDYEKSLL